eukprot:TRINITY_DN65056_c0_g1_i1.p1 TRINITY_DN65056_c0_g1~~TRINITY_DN65056_c0_g1_i1.p1  ORF type:complete len:275 (+),score=35.66 TRINITY_DN65056_c0_g1_i1:52-876(+)
MTDDVDLSTQPQALEPLPLLDHIDDHIWAQTAALLDDSRSLGHLACVARRFAGVAELAAALALSWKPPQVRAWVPQQDSEPPVSWMQLLHEANALQHMPLRFSSHGPSVELSTCGRDAFNGRNGFEAAVASNGPAMRAGRHSADFTLLRQGDDSDTSAGNDIGCWVGVIAASFDASQGVAAINSQADGPALPGQDSLLYTLVCPLFGRAVQGDVISLEIDLDMGTLAVSLNGEPRGLLLTGGLQGPVRWAVDVGYSGAVRISRPTLQDDPASHL